jgi:hypothetical protein
VTKAKRAKKPSGPSPMVIVGRCLSMRVAIRMLRVARKRLRIDDERSAWVFPGAEEMDQRLAADQQKLLDEMRALWPTAAEETEEWLKSDPPLPESIRPPYPVKELA